MIDLAIGVIMGPAFTAITNSMVADMIMPLIGALLGGVHFEGLAFEVGDASIKYGKFIQAVFNFILIALIIFFTLRAILAVEKELSMEKKEGKLGAEPSHEVKLFGRDSRPAERIFCHSKSRLIYLLLRSFQCS